MTDTMTATEIHPPSGYPFRDWATDDDDFYFVPEPLRADYVRAAVRGVGSPDKFSHLIEPSYVLRYPDGTHERHVYDYPSWAHHERLTVAGNAVHHRERAAQLAAASRASCIVCGTIGTTATIPTITVGSWSARACTDCGSTLRDELLARQMIDGRTRLDRVRDAADRMAGDAIP